MAKKRKAGRLAAAEAARPIDPAEAATQPGVRAPAADSQLAVAVEPPEGPRKDAHRAPTLASRVADAAAAQLLIFDELPEDEKPRPGDRVLLVGIVWGGSTLVELEQIWKAGDLPAGRLFDLPASKLPKKFRLVQHHNGGHVLTLPEEMHAEVHQGKASVAALSEKGRRVQAPFRGHAY